MEEMEQVYQAWFLDVYRYTLKLCGEKPLAEDLTSDTFLRAMDAIRGFRGECELRVWLCRIARNLYLSHLRRAGRVIPVAEVPEPSAWTDPAEIISERDLGERILLAAGMLEEPSRQIFFLRALQGQSFRQIAALYGRQDNWACVVFHRARQKIRKTLEEEYDL